jgi:hypothetical protein
VSRSDAQEAPFAGVGIRIVGILGIRILILGILGTRIGIVIRILGEAPEDRRPDHGQAAKVERNAAAGAHLQRGLRRNQKENLALFRG